MRTRYLSVSNNEHEVLNRSLIMSNGIIAGHPQPKNQGGQCFLTLGKDGQVVTL